MSQNSSSVVGILPLHHGADYLRWALLSLGPHVDQMIIGYSRQPCFGRKVDKLCAETEAQMHAIAVEALREVGCPLVWLPDDYKNSRQQDKAMRTAAGDAKLFVRLDADEVWSDGAAEVFIKACLKGRAAHYCPPFRHFWRSFNWCCTNRARAVRGIRPDRDKGRQNVDVEPINHFGYARTPADMQAKFPVKWERPQEGWGQWFHEKFLAWTPDQAETMTDLYPRPCHQWDRAWPFDKELLPALLRDHPYWELELIT